MPKMPVNRMHLARHLKAVIKWGTGNKSIDKVHATRLGLAGAGLDVFETERLPSEVTLRRFEDRCTFSTHNGSNTIETVVRINQMITDIALGVLGIRKAGFYIHQVI